MLQHYTVSQPITRLGYPSDGNKTSLHLHVKNWSQILQVLSLAFTNEFRRARDYYVLYLYCTM